MNERRFEGCLYKILPELDNFIRDGIITKRPIPVSILREKDVVNYPYKALRELMMNAVMHRDYQANMPTRLYQYDNHIEIMNPGGLYGQARPENFPHVNDYRNSVVAGMMKTLNYVNMFNHGVGEVQDLLKDNSSPLAVFRVNLITVFSVIVKEPDVTSLPKFAQGDSAEYEKVINTLAQDCPSIAQVMPMQLKTMLITCKEQVSLSVLMSALSATSRRTFVRKIMEPVLEAKLIALTYPDNPRHPQQKYYLTELGLAVLEELNKA